MLIAAVVCLLLGVGLVSMSFYRGDSIGRFLLPEREARRVWLPGGLILVTMSALFSVLFSTSLPGSPLRQAETRARETRVKDTQMGLHTQYFSAHTQNANNATGTYGYPVRIMPSEIPGTAVAGFERTATALIFGATATADSFNIPARATNRANILSTIEAGDAIALTATEIRTRVTATSTLHPSVSPTFQLMTSTLVRFYGSDTDFEITATALIIGATQTQSAIEFAVTMDAQRIEATLQARETQSP